MALSEKRISVLLSCTNTFGVRGLEEFFDFLFSYCVFVGFESAFGRPNHKKNSQRKKKFKKLFGKQLDGASITIGSIIGVKKNLGRGIRDVNNSTELKRIELILRDNSVIDIRDLKCFL